MGNFRPCKEYIRDESPVVYVLLPVCAESQYDVFFNLLKNVVGKVGRARLTEHFLDNAFKSGMMNDEILIDEDDVSLSWKIRNSKREKIRQSQLLGHWSTANCPTVGKVFFGNTWQAPEDNFVKVNTRKGIKVMAAAEIDNIIFQKMKCHLVELNVKSSTLPNLKHFVKVPIREIEVENESQISKISTMKSFDIKEDYMQKCWEALKRGAWLSNTQVRQKFEEKLAYLMCRFIDFH